MAGRVAEIVLLFAFWQNARRTQRVTPKGLHPEGYTQRVTPRGLHPEGYTQRVTPRGLHPEGCARGVASFALFYRRALQAMRYVL